MAEAGMKWYFLPDVSGKEGKAKEYLEAAMKHEPVLVENLGQVILPTENYAMMSNGKSVIKEHLYIPGYVLVEANLQGEMAHMLRFLPNVLGFLGGLDNPTPIRQSEVNRILGNAEDSSAVMAEVKIPFSVDETVKVIEGPFSGFNDIIEEVNAEKQKLKVMVKIFVLKTPLELAYSQVEKE